MGRKKREISEGSKKAARRFRSRERRESRKNRKRDNFSWSDVRIGGISKDPKDYPYRASCLSFRSSENPPDSICGHAMIWLKKPRWFFGFTKRSDRDEFVRRTDEDRRPRREGKIDA